ncbi:hypothetical protein P280DRAFT_466970 [Massarina eburnea CBS 473.64]|uniref:Uncharacterized protein n=1 Tax=Massarina eburnea CBS 473.64 TaxID=1395130 RepID=A0A6A6SAU1_9PLEO|nr:hypothetical protein P280DRAFT_466970 [Massarina eburnea CBS 473.64]
MALSRAYIPPRALIHTLSGPLSPRCFLARPLPSHFLRGKHSKHPKHPPKYPKHPTDKSPKPPQGLPSVRFEGDTIVTNIPGMPEMRQTFTDEDFEKTLGPMSEEAINDPRQPVINWYEQDLDQGTPPRLRERIATPEDRRRHSELWSMMMEDMSNPDYDRAHLERRLCDDMMNDPNFSDLTEELKWIKSTIYTREEQKAMDERGDNDGEQKMEAEMKMVAQDGLEALLNEPEMIDVQADVRELQDRMLTSDDYDSDEFLEAMENLEAKLSAKPGFMEKVAAMEEKERQEQLKSGKNPDELDRMTKDIELIDRLSGAEDMEDVERLLSPKELQRMMSGDELASIGTSPDGLNELLVKMNEVMKAMGGDKEIQDELEALINNDPIKDAPKGEPALIESEDDDPDNLFNYGRISDEIVKYAKSKEAIFTPVDENLAPELKAKVDKIMQDPDLLQKLEYIQKFVQQAKHKSTITVHDAPDPETLPASETTDIQKQLAIARSTPEHIAALAALRVRLPSPFSISPALKSFNQAIELAYCGATDSVRRILWRSYMKVRTLPTFLANLSDDAWDLLYYSQAVTWSSNRNREDHIKVLLQDLRRVGKDGPPTHPSTLASNQ